MSYWTPNDRDLNESAVCRHGINDLLFCKECQAIAETRVAENIEYSHIVGDVVFEEIIK